MTNVMITSITTMSIVRTGLSTSIMMNVPATVRDDVKNKVTPMVTASRKVSTSLV